MIRPSPFTLSNAFERVGFPHGGWCPKGRRSLDGRIPARYQLVETPTDSYLQRTEWNVRDSDGTVGRTEWMQPRLYRPRVRAA